MSRRNAQKRLAKAKKAALMLAVEQAFAIEAEKQAEKAAEREALIAVNQWTRKGTSCICHPGLGFVS